MPPDQLTERCLLSIIALASQPSTAEEARRVLLEVRDLVEAELARTRPRFGDAFVPAN